MGLTINWYLAKKIVVNWELGTPISTLLVVFSNVIINLTIPRRSFVFGQSRAKVSAGFTNVSSLAVAAFDLVYCSQSVLRFVLVFDISK